MNKKRFIASVFAMLAIMVCSPAAAKPSFSGIFADHAVLQRDHPVVVWGQATASANLKISISDVAVEATADSQGNWRATLPVMRAGGPYTISVTDQTGETQTLTDILIGDVFLCSGQSNMAMTVKASMNGDAEIKSANHENIRLFNVALASAASPQSRLLNSGEWKTATFGNVAEFSAVCFYFARELQPQINVPIGLINAAWGGSAIEAWIGADELAGQGHADEIALLEAYIKDEKAAQARFGAGWESWWTHEFATAGMPWSDRQDESWAPVPLPMRDWKRWNDTDLAQHNGIWEQSMKLT
jgi:sialate O-acetylesterase